MSNANLNHLKGDEHIISGMAATLKWNTAFSRLLADLWEGKIPAVTTGDKPEEKSIFDWTPEDSRYMIEKLTGYELGDALNLTFNKYEGDKNYVPNLKIDGEPANGWFHVFNEKAPEGQGMALSNNVQMTLPPAPEKEVLSALADYMAGGYDYPFTCIAP